MIILIPSLEPDHALPRLVGELRGALPDARVLIVDDGSGSAYAHVFLAAANQGATVIGYAANKGKGYALRTGFSWCMEYAPGEIVVCADSDGQHRPQDIAAVAHEAVEHPNALVLGVRAFTGKVPARSHFGNWASAQFFRVASGVRVSDTQTGLRAYGPLQLAGLMDVPGDRFEWELNALLAAADSGREIRQVPIATVYLQNNSGSHFRPITDSWRVFRPLISFIGASLGCWALEMALFLLLQVHIGILAAVAIARVLSGAANFGINKLGVFAERSRHMVKRQAIEYTLLAVFLTGVTMAGVELLSMIHVPLWLAKTAFDLSGFFVSYAVQRRWIFSRHRTAAESQKDAKSQKDAESQADAASQKDAFRAGVISSAPRSPRRNPVLS